MFLSYHDIVSILGVIIFYGGSFYGLYVIRNTFKNTVKPFMITFILLIIINMYMGVSPAMYGYNTFFTIILLDVGNTGTFKLSNNHLCFLAYSSVLILHTVWRATHWNLPLHTEIMLKYSKYDDQLSLIYFLAQIILPVFFQDSFSLSLYWPAILDILDGMQMTENQLNPLKNPVWVQTLICLAAFMCYIPSLYEIYHLRYPEPTTSSIKLSKRTVNLIQLATSVVLLVVRLALLAGDGSNPIEVCKSIIGLCGHFKMWLKLRCRPEIISVRNLGRRSLLP